MSSDHSQSLSDSEIGPDLKELLLDDSNYFPDKSYEIQEDKQAKDLDNPYIKSLYETAKLKILHRDLVDNEWNKRHEIGLFRLFLSAPLINGLKTWTENKMYKTFGAKVTEDSFNAYHSISKQLSR